MVQNLIGGLGGRLACGIRYTTFPLALIHLSSALILQDLKHAPFYSFDSLINE